ncbi:SRPBCC family protein [Saccharothrix sp. NPDC042600]|uniref:SRPBCC family protein n=1 Tax=Saccharothrix TaxID=2071 RepID=UPI0033C56F68|nr:hypothetical protein GCM10017745_23950 [Saccharothrix mutabilis subsp. capreolus]
MVENVHVRMLPPRGDWVERAVAAWPARDWPPLVLDRPLGVGADGGHGFVRYRCTAYEPGRRVEFTFDPRIGLVGTHAFEVVPGGVRHVIRGHLTGWMRLGWPLAVRWLHDALLEDLLDDLSAQAGVEFRRARWSWWVRVLRAAARRFG